jgi:hypothetical protein
MQYKNCKVCLVEHDSEIHEATVRLHEWLRDRVKRSIEDPQPVEAAADAA